MVEVERGRLIELEAIRHSGGGCGAPGSHERAASSLHVGQVRGGKPACLLALLSLPNGNRK